MRALLVGHFGCFTDQQDLTGQPDALVGSGVEANRIYFDHGLTCSNRECLNFANPSPHAEPEPPWSSPSSTGWPGPCPTPEQSPTSSPPDRSA